MLRTFASGSLPLVEPAFVFTVLFAAVLFSPLAARRARLPGIVGLIVAGILIGPNGIGLVERVGLVEILGSAGLLYLMFQAGAELDLDEFAGARAKALVFGAATFTLPMLVGTGIHLALGFSLLAALLLASCWASHTLLAYPVFQRFGVVGNRAVATAVGATIITDTAALLTLAVVAQAHREGLDVSFLVRIVPATALAAAAILWLLPRIAAWFFAGAGQDRSTRFLFVLVALFGSASLIELAGVEPIVGAFLAGLALNRLIAEGSILSERLEFFGSSFLIPMFLLSVGMLVDPQLFFSEPATLRIAGGFLAVVLVSKFAAAAISGKAFGYSGPEIAAMFSLSVAQAAATLAAVAVGLEIGLLDDDVVNAVVLVILITCIVSSIVAGRTAAHLPPPVERTPTLGRAVLVPVSDLDDVRGLLEVAARVAAPDHGVVLPLNVLDFEAEPETVAAHRRTLVEDAERAVLANGADARSFVRLDLTPTAGMLHAAVEHSASSVLVGWKGYTTRREAFFGQQMDTLLALSPVPVLVCRLGRDDGVQRVVLAVTERDLAPGGSRGLEVAAAAASRIARSTRSHLVIVAPEESEVARSLCDGARVSDTVVDERRLTVSLREHTGAGDLVVAVVPVAAGQLGQAVPRLARAVRDRTLVAVSVGGGLGPRQPELTDEV